MLSLSWIRLTFLDILTFVIKDFSTSCPKVTFDG